MDQDYNFWRDLFDTYQSLTPWLQLAWLIALSALTFATGRGLTRLIQSALQKQPSALSSPPPLGYGDAADERGVAQVERLGKTSALTLEHRQQE